MKFARSKFQNKEAPRMTAGRVSFVKLKPLIELPLLIGCQRTVLIRDVFPDFLFCRILGFFHVGLLHRPWALSLSPVYDDMFAISPQSGKNWLSE